MKRFVLFPLISVTLFLQCATCQNLETVSTVDLEKYMGFWYEIASFPTGFQKGCRCSTAEYQAAPGKDYIRIINKCLKLKRRGSELIEAKAKAFVVEGSGNSRFKVQFFWPFKGKYYIIDLADDYSYAIVGHPNRNYLWILSRDPYMTSEVYSMLADRIKDKGFDITRLQKSEQNCEDK